MDEDEGEPCFYPLVLFLVWQLFNAFYFLRTDRKTFQEIPVPSVGYLVLLLDPVDTEQNPMCAIPV